MALTQNETLTHAHAARTIVTEGSVGAVMINGAAYNVWDLPQEFGFTYEQRNAALANKQALGTHCIIGAVALTLEEFEASHPHITLGQ